MRINLIFGFLGSGKTTLVRRILTERKSQEKMAVIVNEFGNVGIDGAILEGRNVDMIELNSGCLCCTLKGSLVSAVEELRDKAGVEQIVIEATGVADPEDMLESFNDPAFQTDTDMAPLITVVDAPKFFMIRDILGEFYESQIAHADIVLLNKTDRGTPENLEAVRREVTALNPRASFLLTEQCDIDVNLILDAQSGNARRVTDQHDHAQHDHHDHAHTAFGSFVVDASQDSDRASVETFFAGLPPAVWRAKGFMKIDGQPRLIQFTTGQLEITPADTDRKGQMVFIGKDMDQEDIETRFAFASQSGGA